MDRQRDIQDYELLAAVRRRRNDALQADVRNARAEHEHCLARQAAGEDAWHASVRDRDAYAAQTHARTTPGRAVRPADLDSARSHGRALQEATSSAEDACRQAAAASESALATYVAACRHLAANEARVSSLTGQADRWKREAAREMEEREEDERNDAGRVKS